MSVTKVNTTGGPSKNLECFKSDSKLGADGRQANGLLYNVRQVLRDARKLAGRTGQNALGFSRLLLLNQYLS